jgi:N-acetylglucosaminyldiphosphoundecaprenol N-acetyl-beta-D-mannosaminyltransferase
MEIVAAIAVPTAIVWGMLFARRGSLSAGAAAFLVVGYVFGYEFWNAHVGPLPITLDRLVLAGLAAAFVVQWRMGRLKHRKITGSDWLLGGLLLLLATSAVLAGSPDVTANEHSPFGRLAMAFVLPAVLYGIIRRAPISYRAWLGLLACFVVLGGYLAITAMLENAGQWSLVLPYYLADPNLGIHFGRARGPGLNAASLGLYLTACGCCAWTLLGESRHRWQQLALLSIVLLAGIGVFATYTRSTWLGLAAAGLVIAFHQLPRRWRLPGLAAAGLAGACVAALTWGQIVGLEREGTAAEAEHSVDQRASFAYVSWQMFKDHPLVGVGFGRFYDRKLPYLSDRSQPIELESIRPLHHHNTLLGLLTETGLVGLTLFVAVLGAWTRSGWQLATLASALAPRWLRLHGILMLALLANYMCSAVFHDLTLVPAQHWLLFLFAAVTINLQQSTAGRTFPIRRGLVRSRIFRSESSAPASTVQLFGMTIDRVQMPQAVSRLLAWCDEPRGAACRYVVTPNVDHAVLFQQRADLRAAYRDASLVLADGAPIVWASRLLGTWGVPSALPERVAGSDLVPQLFAAAARPLRVFLLGAAEGVAGRAALRIARQWPCVQIVGTYSPPPSFEHDAIETEQILTLVADAAPDLLIVGFGAPKQELWVHQHQFDLQAKVVICAGATIDFLAGEKRRSPRWMRQCGLEWAHRVLSEPRRLTSRYARDAWIFPRLVWRELAKG